MSYDKMEIISRTIKSQTNLLVAAGKYNEAYALYLSDPLKVDGITLKQFVLGTLDTMRRAFENECETEAHARFMERVA